MSFEQGPYLITAAFCENVIEDKTGVLSLIRIVDRVTVNAVGYDVPTDMPPNDFRCKLVITLKSGKVRGTHTIRVTPHLPSGEVKPPIETAVFLEGENKGCNLVADMQIRLERPGVQWYQIHFDDEFLTQIPLEAIYTFTRVPQPPPTT